jgi:hypothetical protein
MRCLVLVATILCACQSTALPPGEGAGLVSIDQTPPSGVEVFQRPSLQEGDRFLFRRAGVLPLELHVVEATDAGYRLRDKSSGTVTVLDRDLGEGSVESDEKALQRVQSPADPVFSWPLWVGKKWVAEYLIKVPGGEPLPVQSRYHCDAIETLSTPLGELRCVRIWRRIGVTGTSRFMEKAGIIWYSPDLGFYVRRLENGYLLELEGKTSR